MGLPDYEDEVTKRNTCVLTFFPVLIIRHGIGRRDQSKKKTNVSIKLYKNKRLLLQVFFVFHFFLSLHAFFHVPSLHLSISSFPLNGDIFSIGL